MESFPTRAGHCQEGAVIGTASNGAHGLGGMGSLDDGGYRVVVSPSVDPQSTTVLDPQSISALTTNVEYTIRLEQTEDNTVPFRGFLLRLSGQQEQQDMGVEGALVVGNDDTAQLLPSTGETTGALSACAPGVTALCHSKPRRQEQHLQHLSVEPAGRPVLGSDGRREQQPPPAPTGGTTRRTLSMVAQPDGGGGMPSSPVVLRIGVAVGGLLEGLYTPQDRTPDGNGFVSRLFLQSTDPLTTDIVCDTDSDGQTDCTGALPLDLSSQSEIGFNIRAPELQEFQFNLGSTNNVAFQFRATVACDLGVSEFQEIPGSVWTPTFQGSTSGDDFVYNEANSVTRLGRCDSCSDCEVFSSVGNQWRQQQRRRQQQSCAHLTSLMGSPLRLHLGVERASNLHCGIRCSYPRQQRPPSFALCLWVEKNQARSLPNHR